MLDRRSLLVSTAAAAGAIITPTASGAVREVKIDPFAMTPAQKAYHTANFPTFDSNSYQDFVNGFVKWQRADPKTAASLAHRDLFLKSKGLSADAPSDLSYEQAYDTMLQDPIFAARERFRLSTQALRWDRAQRYFHHNRDKYLALMEKSDKAGAGKLELDPTLEIPEYARYEVHTQPGGMIGDPFMGFIYHHSLRLRIDMYPEGHPELAGKDNDADELYTALAQGLSEPEDGKVTRILDLGCGTGAYTTGIKERFPDAEVWGIDMSGPMLRYAKYRASKMDIGVNFSQRLAENTKFPDNHFDIVTDHILIHEVSPPAAKAIVAEAHRVLRPGGIFRHFDAWTAGYDHGAPVPPRSIVEKAALWSLHRYNYEIWQVAYVETDFPQVLRDAGFAVDTSVSGIRPWYPGLLGTKKV